MLSESDGCGFCRTDLKLGDFGNVTSPGFPSSYPSSLQCLWLMQTEDGSRIRLTCSRVQLQSCGTLGEREG